MEESLKQVIEILGELSEDQSVSRNIKGKSSAALLLSRSEEWVTIPCSAQIISARVTSSLTIKLFHDLNARWGG